MNVFVAGVWGAGKTYLADRLAPILGMKHRSASQLIREERGSANWAADKRVSNIDENQLLLANAVRRENANGTRLLLDGHFVLRDTKNRLIRLNQNVFESLQLSGVLLIEVPVDIVIHRIAERDHRVVTASNVMEAMDLEEKQCLAVCAALGLRVRRLSQPSEVDFVIAVKGLLAD